MSRNLAGLKEMIESELFTIEMCIQYLLKNKDKQDVLELIVSKLRTYDRREVMNYIIELVFFNINHQCTELELFFLDLCAEDFKYFFMITTTFEIWGFQFTVTNQNMKKRIRNMLEDCETSMVNGEKCLNNYKTLKSDGGSSEKVEISPDKLNDFVIGKKSKNDFKDDVRYFTNYLVKLAYLLIREDGDRLRKVAIEYLHKLNLYLYERRNLNNGVISQYRYVYNGISLPFKNDPSSDLVI